VPFYRVGAMGGDRSRDINGGRRWWVLMTLNVPVMGVESEGNKRAEDGAVAPFCFRDARAAARR
jgi:hypothetical protein